MIPGDHRSAEQGPESGPRARLPSTSTVIFARNREYWTVGYAGSIFPLKDVKGLSYIQRLLQHPAEEFHSLDLLNGPGTGPAPVSNERSLVKPEGTDSVGGLGDAGEMLDARAKIEYKHRLVQLNEQLDDLRERGERDRADQVESEIEFLRRELARALGLGGRDRHAGSTSERARLNVTRAIKAALQKISEQDATFSEFLRRSIRTGTFCSYVPDSRASLNWRFSAEGRDADFAPEAMAPLLLRRDTILLQPADGQTPFVAREAEREILRSCLELALKGQGRMMMVSGAPGVGKSRIAAEFAAEASGRGVLALAGSCYDLEHPVPFNPFVEILEAALAQASSPELFRRALGSNAAEVARLMPQLRQMFPDIPPPLDISPELSRRALFNAIMELLARAARNTPVLLLLEDLHWADEGTLSLVTHLSRSVRKLPVLVLGTYRDTEIDPDGPLAQTLEDLIRLHVVERINLRGLPHNAVADMIRALSRREPPQALVALIHSNTEGNPFFVEELLRHLIERGQLTGSKGELRQDLKSLEINVPHSLRLVIERRLSRLSDDARTVLGFAAVIGRSFTFELLQSTAHSDTELLLDCVEEAEKTGLLTSTLEYPESLFQFSHELIRQSVLSGMSAPRRQRIHLNVAEALERLYPGRLEDCASDLAHHLWQAGKIADPDKTITFLAIAAKRALVQSAYEAAIRDVQNALTLLKQLPHSKERAHCELNVLFDYGLALLATRGWYVPERETVYMRAHELCQELGDDPRLFSVLFGLCSFHQVRGQHVKASSYTDEMTRVGFRLADDGTLVQARWATGSCEFFVGQFLKAHASFQQAISQYDWQRHRTLALEYGQDPCMSCLCYDATTLWILGHAEQAEKRAEDSLKMARELGHPFSLVWCLANLTIYYLIRRNLCRAVELIDEGAILTKEHGFGFFEEGFRAYQLIVLTVQGNLEQMGAGDRGRRFSETGYEICQTWMRSAFAEGLGNLGKIRTAVALIDQASEVMERNEERYFEAEIHRIKGELILRKLAASPDPSGNIQSAEAAAEQSFREAMAIASRQNARMFELRAAVSLGRLLGRAGREAEAHILLSRTYDWFTEGFDTPDLTAAKSLLDSFRN
jgi:tetratricopeptide (TPR) repeat protein